LAIWAAIAALMGVGLARLEIDTSTSSFLDRGDPAAAGEVPIGQEFFSLGLAQHGEGQVGIFALEQFGEETIALVDESQAIVFPYPAEIEIQGILEAVDPLAKPGEEDPPAGGGGDLIVCPTSFPLRCERPRNPGDPQGV
jgi:hypothetical protein